MSDATERPEAPADADTDIRIYVACLACYNAGKLHGVWIDATQDADVIDGVRAQMQDVCGHTDNDWAIHDAEGFHGLRLSEHARFDRVSEIANAIEEHGEAMAAWIDNRSGDTEDALSSFADAYRGKHRSVRDYAEDMLDDMGTFNGMDSMIARYFDFESFARDLVLGGDIWVHEDNNGDVHIFDGTV